MAKNICFALFASVILVTAVCAQKPLEVRRLSVRVDGDLGEWRGIGSETLNLSAREQVWSDGVGGRRKWGGAKDLSAEFQVAFDTAHLYLAGKVRDDHHVEAGEGQMPEHADAIELFLDIPGGADAEAQLGGEDVQLFLLPLVGKCIRRPWDPKNPGKKPLPPTGAELTGVQVAARRDPGAGWSYAFEARIALHNFVGPGVGVRDIGLHLALDDADPGPGPGHYMTLDGSNPTQGTGTYRRLRFAGPPPLAPPEAPGLGLGAELAALAPWGLVAVLVLGAILLFSRRRPLVHLKPVPALMARIGGVVVLLVGLLLPGWLSKHHHSPVEDRLDAAVEVLRTQLPRMEQGTLKSYVGEARDQPLLDLLEGRQIKRQQVLSYDYLAQMAPGRFGPRPPVYPRQDFPVRPYWIPLPAGQPQRFTFRKSLASPRLAIVVAEPRRPDAFFPEAAMPTLRLTYRRTGEPEDEPATELDLINEPQSADVFGRSGLRMTHVAVELRGPVESLSLTALDGVDVELVGLTTLPIDLEDRPAPLLLGQPIGEIESDLRGIYPEDAGVALAARGRPLEVPIPAGRQKKFHRLWLVYHATYPGEMVAPDLAEGDQVCKVTLQMTNGEERVVSLEHQRAMFYELGSRNQDVPEGVPAVQVAVGTGGGNAELPEKRINVVYRVDLPGGRDDGMVKAIRFENKGPYPIRFRSVIFGWVRASAITELADSPLQHVGEKVKLIDQHAAKLAGMAFGIYRNGFLSRATEGATAGERRQLPKVIRDRLKSDPDGIQRTDVDEVDARVFSRYIPVREDSTVVLCVWAEDPDYAAQLQRYSLIGVVLALLSAPFLLLLFNDALGKLANLRLRLMALVSVAALVPLAVLFVLLVRVLEGGHEDDLQGRMRQAVRTTSDQLRDRQAKLLESTRSWAAYLKKQEQAFRKGKGPHDISALRAEFSQAMGNQLPPEWRDGGFMRLDYVPEAGAPTWLEPFTTSVGDQRLVETPLRDEPGFSIEWNRPILGVRCQDGPIALSVARPVDTSFLANISPQFPAVLCEAKNDYGYQLAQTEAATEDADHLLGAGDDLGFARGRVLKAAADTRQPVFMRHQAGGMDWIAAYDVVRDLRDTPRALLGLFQRDSEATLTLGIGSVPVRTFFLAMSALLLVLAIVLASIVTSRITEPIERLESGAEALRRGRFDVRVVTDEKGQIGRLTDSFNNMAQDLRARIQDLNHLNRGIQELTSRLDLDQVLASAIAFFTRHSSADRVRVMLLDWERDRVEVFGDTVQEVDRSAEDVAALLEASGAVCMAFDRGRSGRALPALFPQQHSLLALPLMLAGRSRGCVLLLFETAHPEPVNLALLGTIAAQTAAAIENARLYRHAVEDRYTGAYAPEYFSRLVGHAVAAAQADDRMLSLLGFRLTRGAQMAESLGAEGYGRHLERVARGIRTELGGGVKIGRTDDHTFQVILPGVDRDHARTLRQSVARRLASLEELDLRGPSDLRVSSAVFPEEGASAEFLFHALESKLSDVVAESRAAIEPLADGDGVVLSSPAMIEVVRVLKKVAASDLTILLAGETGTGKEVLTNLLHKWSKRARGPLVKVHCAALSESLLQSELFGHEKGAFTGADERKLGKFELADGGTVFLDEIGEISLDTQVKLLRVLQEREVDRVGGVRPVPVDVRVVAATNRNIEEMVAEGTFREDLYYRLQGMVITVPPLRERKSEIPALLEVFRREAVTAGHTGASGFSTDAMDEFFRRDWPGNIRELRNTAFRAMVLAGDGQVERSHLLGILPRVDGPPAPVTAHGGGAEHLGAPEREDSPEPTVEIPLPASRTPAVEGSGLSGRLGRLYDLICARGSLSNHEYVEEAGVSSRTGLRDLSELLERGLIERTGRRRGARYHARAVESQLGD